MMFQPSDIGFHFILKRIQFPVKLAFTVTINKSQGQTFEKVGIFLDRPCFSHGQLYVAFLQARAFTDIKLKFWESREQGVYTNDV